MPGLILLTYWSLIVPSIVIGESRALASFGQSWRTVRGFAWNVFGTYVVVFLILIAVRIVLSIIFVVLPLAARNFIGDIVSGTLIAPFIAIVVSLIYYRLTAAHMSQAPPPGYPPPGYPASAGYPPPPTDYPPAPPPA